MNITKGEEMEQRQLGRSGLMVPALSFGTGTFAGANDFFKPWGAVACLCYANSNDVMACLAIFPLGVDFPYREQTTTGEPTYFPGKSMRT